jgi:hypothetical protein
MAQLRRDANGAVTGGQALADGALRTALLEGEEAGQQWLAPTPEHPDVDLEPISPELVLVSPPEVARRARELLPDRSLDPVEPRPDEAPSREAAEPPAPPATRPLTGTVSRLLAAGVAACAVGFVIGREWNGTLPGPGWLPGHAARVASVEPPPSAGHGRSQHTAVPPATTAATPTQPSTHASKPPAAKPPAAKPPTAKPTPTPTTGSQPAAPPPAPKPTTTVKPRTRTQPEKPAKAPTKRSTANGGQPGKRTSPPAPATGFTPARVFAWPPSSRAHGYMVRFYRDGRKIFERWTDPPKLTLPDTFRFTAGHYRWEVRPVLGPRTRLGAPIVASQFVVGASGTVAP